VHKNSKIAAAELPAMKLITIFLVKFTTVGHEVLHQSRWIYNRSKPI